MRYRNSPDILVFGDGVQGVQRKRSIPKFPDSAFDLPYTTLDKPSRSASILASAINTPASSETSKALPSRPPESQAAEKRAADVSFSFIFATAEEEPSTTSSNNFEGKLEEEGKKLVFGSFNKGDPESAKTNVPPELFALDLPVEERERRQPEYVLAKSKEEIDMKKCRAELLSPFERALRLSREDQEDWAIPLTRKQMRMQMEYMEDLTQAEKKSKTKPKLDEEEEKFWAEGADDDGEDQEFLENENEGDDEADDVREDEVEL
ncbi:hypothetical protein G7Y89_g2016 [Cudoniella acicularis]|uniref:Uncharacterized protein n=1 Tax=Cudoniella acicularis TaxID=354080 RepID=A0A8H4RUY4_9HELO|nr:hypothetical protein G7Y89_g2016 [Cudoniella acicularis]